MCVYVYMCGFVYICLFLSIFKCMCLFNCHTYFTSVLPTIQLPSRVTNTHKIPCPQLPIILISITFIFTIIFLRSASSLTQLSRMSQGQGRRLRFESPPPSLSIVQLVTPLVPPARLHDDSPTLPSSTCCSGRQADGSCPNLVTWQ